VDNIRNRDTAIENKKLLLQKDSDISSEISNLDKQINEMNKFIGSIEQKREIIKLRREELESARKAYRAFELYQKCMHSGGISYEIIKKRLPLINSEIQSILSEIVDFQVILEDDGKKLDISIQHRDSNTQPIEMASGAEKTLAAMAIRLALIEVSNLPKSDIFILDEPGTSLDEENMEGFIKILNMLRGRFRTVIVISHLEALKEVCDKHIIINKDEDLCANVVVTSSPRIARGFP
jgi:exonuclease SbcC